MTRDRAIPRAGSLSGRTATAVLPSLGLSLATLAALVTLATCGAPASQPVEGEVARQVRAALDSGTARFDHATWDTLLAAGTRDGLVDYRYFQRNRERLERYLGRVADAEIGRLAPDHLKALLINAYNAYTVLSILEHPSVGSIRDIDGVWTESTHPVGGHPLTLDQMEHNVLRPFYRDPRIHFAVNCASLSCAPLPPWAFSGDSLDAELERRTRHFLRDTANVRIEGGALLLSRYFDWYGGDFTKEGWSPRAETIPRFVARYARPEVEDFVEAHDGRPEVRFLEYDWSLNATVRPAASGAGASAPVAGGVAADASSPREPPARRDTVAAGSEPPSGSGWVRDLRRWVEGFGLAAPLVYGLLYAVAVVALVPGSALTIGAGVAFGLLWGTVVASVASVLGAGLAFLVARHLLRDRVARWVAGREKFAAVDEAVAREGWKVVALTRLSPVFPFNFLNYAYGVTRVGFWPYLVTSWIAMLPGTLLYVYLGVAGTEVAAAATGAADWGRTTLQVIGVLATLAVVVVVTRTARRVLREASGLESFEEAPDEASPGERSGGAGGADGGGARGRGTRLELM